MADGLHDHGETHTHISPQFLGASEGEFHVHISEPTRQALGAEFTDNIGPRAQRGDILVFSHLDFDESSGESSALFEQMDLPLIEFAVQADEMVAPVDKPAEYQRQKTRALLDLRDSIQEGHAGVISVRIGDKEYSMIITPRLDWNGREHFENISDLSFNESDQVDLEIFGKGREWSNGIMIHELGHIRHNDLEIKKDNILHNRGHSHRETLRSEIHADQFMIDEIADPLLSLVGQQDDTFVRALEGARSLSSFLNTPSYFVKGVGNNYEGTIPEWMGNHIMDHSTNTAINFDEVGELGDVNIKHHLQQHIYAKTLVEGFIGQQYHRQMGEAPLPEGHEIPDEILADSRSVHINYHQPAAHFVEKNGIFNTPNSYIDIIAPRDELQDVTKRDELNLYYPYAKALLETDYLEGDENEVAKEFVEEFVGSVETYIPSLANSERTQELLVEARHAVQTHEPLYLEEMKAGSVLHQDAGYERTLPANTPNLILH